MKIAKWKDGSILDTCPRREDPLYYYLQSADWGRAIGFTIDPEYDEHQATEVIIGVFDQHKHLITALDEIEQDKIYGRVIGGLLAEYPQWCRIRIALPYMASITSALCECGFTLAPEADVRWQSWEKLAEQVEASDR